MSLAPTPTPVIRYTLNARRGFTCTDHRPCYRYRVCKECLGKRRSSIIQQVGQLYFAWRLDTFLTISYLGVPMHPQEALKYLQVLKRKAFRYIPSGVRYVCFMACEIGPLGSNPHLHLLISESNSSRYLRVPMKTDDLLGNPNFRDLAIDTVMDAMKIAGYLFDRNFVPTLPYMPRRARLISGSRGFRAGRPIKLRETLWQQAVASF